ncbi:MAG: MotA/TolQ/ExbB proton channel family protein [Deltaproteobacteria bacterium]|nr:MotA/TolQ/ExbB proton channel family protein [Deltaproteobacteria bacterium]
METRSVIFASILLFLFTTCPSILYQVSAQEEEAGKATLFSQYEKIQNNLEQSLQELSNIQEEIAAEKLPITKELNQQEERLSEARSAYENLSSALDSRNMDLNHLRSQIDSLNQQQTYISSLLGEYVRSLETQLHIAEVQTYEEMIKEAKLALSNETLNATQVFDIQLATVEPSINRLEGLLGGTKFYGEAVGNGGNLMMGHFMLIGPTAYFTAEDGTITGYVVEMLGSAKPTVISFENLDSGISLGLKRLNPFRGSDSGETRNFSVMTQNTILAGKGLLPIDTTLGDAHKLAQTKDTLLEHMKKGGIVMIPILSLAGLALIIAVVKWTQLAQVKMPSAKSLTDLLSDMRNRAIDKAKRKAGLIIGPAGDMLQSAIDHLHQPKELVEEVMYEKILETRTRLNKTLPFIAVCASSAPLLGLLGTVTGIINTFKLISAFGSGDAKTLSSGISEALVTTEFGLIVAIPSLLLHAFLNRKAKSIIDRMESIAVAVMNQVTKSHLNEYEDTNEFDDSIIDPNEKEIAHG